MLTAAAFCGHFERNDFPIVLVSSDAQDAAGIMPVACAAKKASVFIFGGKYIGTTQKTIDGRTLYYLEWRDP